MKLALTLLTTSLLIANINISALTPPIKAQAKFNLNKMYAISFDATKTYNASSPQTNSCRLLHSGLLNKKIVMSVQMEVSNGKPRATAKLSNMDSAIAPFQLTTMGYSDKYGFISASEPQEKIIHIYAYFNKDLSPDYASLLLPGSSSYNCVLSSIPSGLN